METDQGTRWRTGRSFANRSQMALANHATTKYQLIFLDSTQRRICLIDLGNHPTGNVAWGMDGVSWMDL